MIFNLFKKKEEEKPQYSANKSLTNQYVKSLSSGAGLPASPLNQKATFTSANPLATPALDAVNKAISTPKKVQEEKKVTAPTIQSTIPGYISGYENLAANKNKLLADQKASQEQYLNDYYSTVGKSNQQNIDALNRNLAQNQASYQQNLAMQQARTDTKKQQAEDEWGESQRLAAQTRSESEARNRNKFAALGTTSSWGAGSYGQAQENVESDFNRYTQQGLRQKEANLQELDFALQQYELESQAKLDDLEMQVTQALNSIAQNQALSEVEKANAIRELGFAYENAKLEVQEGLEGVYMQYYNQVAASEASGLSFDDAGNPLNQSSYEWMLKNPTEYGQAFQSEGGGKSASKVRGIIEQLAGMNTKGITGLYRGALSGEARAAEGLIKQLTSELQLEEARRMKGQGQMSDAEREILANSVAAFNLSKGGLPTVSDTRFKQILDELYQQYGGTGSTQPSLSSFEG